MKIEVNRASIEFYDELLYITGYYKRILKNPRQKVRPLSKQYFICILVYGIYSLLLATLLIVTGFDIISTTVLIILLLLLLLMIKSFIAVKKRLNDYINSPKDSIFEITEENIKLDKKTSQKVILTWNCIDKILINKYSIAFIPKDLSLVVIGISIDYKSQILQVIEKYNKKDLVIDNTNFYK